MVQHNALQDCMKQGFSLVELSIVLVILGLLTGGILAGQSLIRASELRAVTTEYQRIITATQTFRDKYMALPGDMANATRFWGRTVNAAHCVTNSAAAVTAPGTCDGTGSGFLETVNAANQSAEMFQFVNQLALAGLVEGSYSGMSGASAGAHATSSNVFSSKLNNGYFTPSYVISTFAGDANAYALNYSNHLRFGALTGTGQSQGPLLKPEEAWGIDTKLDDGKPAYGKVIAYYWNNLCAAADDGTHANNDFAASYKLTDSSVQCSLFFRDSF